MALLVVGVLQKLGGHTLSVDAGSHEIIASVTQYTNDLSCQCFVQHLDHCSAVGAVALGHSSIVDMLSGAFAQSLDISEKWFISHGLTPCLMNLGEHGY